MSYINRISKRKEEYRDAIKKSKTDAELQNQFRKLDRTIPQRKRRTTLTKQEMQNLDSTYRETIVMLTDKMKAMEERIKTYNEAVDKYKSIKPYIDNPNELNNIADDKQRLQIIADIDDMPKTIRDIKNNSKIAAQYIFFRKIRKALSKDLRTIDICIKKEKYLTVTQLYENSRSERIQTDLSKAEKFGANLSIRYRINLKEENGVLRTGRNADLDGFFTISKKTPKTSERLKEIKEINKKNYGNKSVFSKGDRVQDIELLAFYLSRRVSKQDELFDAVMREPEKLIASAYSTGKRKAEKNRFKKRILHYYKSDIISDEQKAHFDNILDKISSDPGSYIAFIEYINSYAKAENELGINEEIGISPDAKMDKRNSAMSMVADLIGCGKLIANSRNLQVMDTSTGKIYGGTFMEKAKGCDRNSVNTEDLEKFNQLSPSKIENSLQLKKDIANLQILDWICGNGDRHSGNILYKIDDDGNLVGLVGIDNDTSFGDKDHNHNLSGINLENMVAIPEETAQKIMDMNKESFKIMLYGYDLSATEVNKALDRLEKLKVKLTTDAEYYKDKPMGYVEAGRIKTVSDEEMNKLSMYCNLAYGGRYPADKEQEQGLKDKNLFEVVANRGIGAKGYKQCRENLRKAIFKANGNFVKEFYEMEKRSEEMDKVHAKTWFSHEQFPAMMQSLKNTKDVFSKIDKLLVNEGNKENMYNPIPSYEEITKMREQLNESLKACNTYIRTKNEAEIMRKSKTSNGYLRYKLAKDAKAGVQKALNCLGQIEEYTSKREEYNKSLQGHNIKCKTEYDEIYRSKMPKVVELFNQAVAIENNKEEIKEQKINNPCL